METRTQPEIERSFSNDPFYEYAYHAASTVFWSTEEDFYESDQGYRQFYLIQSGEVEFPFSKEEYDKNEDIQDSLALIGLDPDKFWEAIRYIYHIALLRNSDVVTVYSSVRDRIEDLISALQEDTSNVYITMKRPGKKTVTIADPQTLAFINVFLQHENNLLSVFNVPEYNGSDFDIGANYSKDLGQRWFIYDQYLAYKSIFDKFCTDTELPKRSPGQKGTRDKDLIISRLLYFTKTTDDNRYLDSRDPLRSIVDKCSKTSRPRCDWEGGWGTYTPGSKAQQPDPKAEGKEG